MPAEKKVYIQTFGCQMNEHDSRLMAGLLAEDGYTWVTSPEEADLVLVNTCSIREKAEHKVFSLLGQYRGLKDERPDLLIGVGGCVAQQQGEVVLKRAPFVDLVFGTQNVRKIRDLVRDAASMRGVVATGWASDKQDRFREGALLAPYGSVDGVTAFVTVAEGCDHFCSFCIVPFTRGREASRTPEQIVGDVRALAERGVVEVTLLGQNVNSYGKRTDYDFARLLDEVCGVEGIRRVRFTSSHPRDVTREQIEAYGRLPALARHMHLPVQSGSDRVLALMNRRYTFADYVEKMDRLRSVDPTVAVTTDLIVGYPGETDADFEQTLALMERVNFDHSFSFKYSPRPGTRAAEMPDAVPEEVKDERLQLVLGLQDRLSRAHNEKFVGRAVEVLVETHDGGVWKGRTSCNRIVSFTEEEPSGAVARGKIVPVEVTRAFPYALRGECGAGVRV